MAHSPARRARLVGCLAAAALVFCVATPSSAQLYRASPSSGVSTILDMRGAGGLTRGNDIGYDPANNVYLVVAGYGPIYGQFVDAAGAILAPMFTIMDGSVYWGHLPRAIYSPHVNGGLGGFLVTWHENSYGPSENEVHGVIVSYPTGVVSPDRTISSGLDGTTFWEMPASAAYSITSRRFLVVWTTLTYGIQGRFVDEYGVPIGSVMPIENPGGARWPGVAWNGVSNQFGIGYGRWGATSAWVAYRQLGAADGLLSPRNSFGFTTGTYAADLQFNPGTGNLVMAWSTGSDVQAAAFDPAGNLIGSGLVSIYLRYCQDNLGLSFNPFSRTFLVVGHSGGADDIGVELNSNGAPNSSYEVITGGATLGSYYPRASANTTAPQWGVSFAMNLKVAAAQIIGTTSTNGGSNTPIGSAYTGGGSGGTPIPCTTPDPFVSLGGGVCVNGGWQPPGSGGGSTGGSTGGCTTPDPFTALGGGVCVNGGWLPPGSSGGSTGGSTGGCTTPDPFAAIGGGTCVNGGWVPGVAGGTTPSTGGCTTPDPFASIGGGTCVNGGWVPGGSGGTTPSTGGCTTPDPFASIGGGTCVNGGWVPGGSGGTTPSTGGCTTPQPGAGWTCVNGGWLPPGMGGTGSTGGSTGGCTTPDPFASLGGGICVNGGWLPPGSTGGSTGSCTTPDPFASLGGGICVNGGWIPRGL